MSRIQIFHNPRFLEYRDHHNQIVQPLLPTASMELPASLSQTEQLDQAFAHTQHGVHYASWFHDPTVIPHLRSTSVGDLLALGNGQLFVVERVGFQPYQPDKTHWPTAIAEAMRELETAAALTENKQLQSAIEASLTSMNQALLAEGYQVAELPETWEKAQIGDLVGNDTTGHYRVFARRLEPQWRATFLMAHLPQATLYRDITGWAVLQPEKALDILKRWL